MARVFLDTRGLEDFVETIRKISDNSEDIIDKALEAGADVVADSVRAEINALPTGKTYGTEGKKRTTVYPEEKEAISSSFGISKPRTFQGNRNIKIGFGGYSKNGKANILIARSINSGTSFSKKFGFFNRGVNHSKSAAKEKVKEVFLEEIKKIT